MFDKSTHKSPGDKSSSTEGSAPFGTSTAAESQAPRGGRGESATIGPSIRIKGELSGEEDLVIEGSVEGTVHLEKNNVTIGNNGRVNADIHANTITILGELRGDVTGNEKVVIRKTGNVRGNIVAPRVSLEEGAMFKGSIEMEPNKAAATSGSRSESAASTSRPVKAEPPTKGAEAGA
jgi:cytoskeletal protein CcmA (bactofilin family)